MIIVLLAIPRLPLITKQIQTASIAHVEIEAIQLASKILGKKKFDVCTLDANAESCGMYFNGSC